MLSRKKPKIDFEKYTTDELFIKLNKEFIEKGSDSIDITRSWCISPTVWEEESKRFMVGDSRETDSDGDIEDEWDYLPPYYGSSIREAIINAIQGEIL